MIAADGRIGGFSAPGGTATKQRILAIEQARPVGPSGLFDDLDKTAFDHSPARTPFK